MRRQSICGGGQVMLLKRGRRAKKIGRRSLVFDEGEPFLIDRRDVDQGPRAIAQQRMGGETSETAMVGFDQPTVDRNHGGILRRAPGGIGVAVVAPGL